jgi:hypothetical protein
MPPNHLHCGTYRNDHLQRGREVRKALKVAALVAVTAAAGCVSVPVTTTVVAEPGKRVTAEESKFSPFWLSPLPPETASRLLDDLLNQCGGADLTGVTIGTSSGWVVIGQVEKIVVSGYCVEPGQTGIAEGASLPKDGKTN